MNIADILQYQLRERRNNGKNISGSPEVSSFVQGSCTPYSVALIPVRQ